jgi:hypothetical protein
MMGSRSQNRTLWSLQVSGVLAPYDAAYITKLVSNYRSHTHLLSLPSGLFYAGELQVTSTTRSGGPCGATIDALLVLCCAFCGTLCTYVWPAQACLLCLQAVIYVALPRIRL